MSYYSRNLPHWHPESRTIFLTWRLYGSLPRVSVRKLQLLHNSPGKQFAAADQELDQAATGPRWLRDPKIATITEAAIRRGAELNLFILHAFVIMPNHVHILIDPGTALSRITCGIKTTSAKNSNAILARAGQTFWQDESFDHWVRTAAQFERIKSYIELNPVKVGLAKSPSDWPWSSAHK